MEGHAENGVVVGLGAATGEDNLLWASIEERGDLFTGGFDGGAGALSEGVDGRGIAELRGEIGEHGIEDGGVDGGGGVVIEVDVLHGSGIFRIEGMEAGRKKSVIAAYGSKENGTPSARHSIAIVQRRQPAEAANHQADGITFRGAEMLDCSRTVAKRDRGASNFPREINVLDGNYRVERTAWADSLQLEMEKGARRSTNRLAGCRSTHDMRGCEEPYVQDSTGQDPADGERPDRHDHGVGANLHGLQQQRYADSQPGAERGFGGTATESDRTAERAAG